MKKIPKIIASILVLGAAFWVICVICNVKEKEVLVPDKWLRVDESRIVDYKGDNIQLKGISTHGLQWFGDLYNADSIAHLKEEMGINVFRVAMYTDPNDGGYIKNRSLKEKVYELVDACIAQDLYVIIDWHILNDNNPQTYQAEAIEFFAEVSERYADSELVIYEICNEPNGSEVTWSGSIRPYAENVIATIRERSQRSLIVVGTPDWSKDFDDVAKNPLNDSNVAYTLHFYAGSHNKTLRNKVDEFRNKGLAVFVSECGATDASGDGGIYEEAFERWVNWMNESGISWLFWSYSNKNEGSSLLKPGAKPDLVEGSIESELSDTGRFIKRMLEI